MKISRTVVDWNAEFRVSNKFKFPCEKKNKIPLFLDSNQDVADELLLYDKKNTVDTKLLEGIFHYFPDKVKPNLMKLMNSPSLTKNKDLASLLEYEERAEAKNSPATRKNYIITKETVGSITKEDLFRRHGLLCVFTSTMNIWVHRLSFWYETRKKTTT